MDIDQLRKNWNKLGKIDPLWAILTWDEKKGNRWQLEEFFRTGEEEVTRIMEYVRSLGIELGHRRALDFGCGVGRLSQALARHFSEVCGVDIASSMIRRAKKYNRHKNCEFFLNERPDLRLFDNATFDFIYTSLTLQHIEPRYIRAYLGEFLRLLNSGGVLVFNLPSERVAEQGKGLESECAVRTAKPVERQQSGSLLRIRQRIKSLAPRSILDALIALRDDGTPVMEMFGMKRDEVERFLKRNRGTVVNAVELKLASEWIGYRYCVTLKLD